MDQRKPVRQTPGKDNTVQRAASPLPLLLQHLLALQLEIFDAQLRRRVRRNAPLEYVITGEDHLDTLAGRPAIPFDLKNTAASGPTSLK